MTMTKQPERWYVQVAIEVGRLLRLERYEIGPVMSWARARDLARDWESEHGPNTAHVSSTRKGVAAGPAARVEPADFPFGQR